MDWWNPYVTATVGGDVLRRFASDFLPPGAGPVPLEVLSSMTERAIESGSRARTAFSFDSGERRSAAQMADEVARQTGRFIAYPRLQARALAELFEAAEPVRARSGISYAPVDLGDGTALSVPVVLDHDGGHVLGVQAFPVVDRRDELESVVTEHIVVPADGSDDGDGDGEWAIHTGDCGCSTTGAPRCKDLHECRCLLYPAVDATGGSVYFCSCRVDP